MDQDSLRKEMKAKREMEVERMYWNRDHGLPLTDRTPNQERDKYLKKKFNISEMWGTTEPSFNNNNWNPPPPPPSAASVVQGGRKSRRRKSTRRKSTRRKSRRGKY
jgi:hypothetical protein